MSEIEREHDDVLAALRAATPADLPVGLGEALAQAAEADRRPPAPFAAYEEHADAVYTFLVALTDDAARAEDLVVETFGRAGKKGDPTLPQLLQTARHAALEDMEPTERVGLGPADWALVLERRMGLDDAALARGWSQLPARIHERLDDAGARVFAAVRAAHAGSTDCGQTGHLPAALLDRLEDEEAVAYAQHLGSCSACAEWNALLEETMSPTPRTLPDGIRSRKEIEKRLAPPAEEVEVADLDIQVAVSCCYCHDRLGRTEAAFCAACLAPHHPDCFQEHAGCATPGCPGTRVVYPSGPPEPKAAPRRRRGWFPAALGAMLAVGGVAALTISEPRVSSSGSYEFQGQRYETPAALREAIQANQQQAQAKDLPDLLQLTDPQAFRLSPGTYTLEQLLAALRWFSGYSLNVDSHALALERQGDIKPFVFKVPQALDREQLRALLADRGCALLVGPGETARIMWVNNMAQKIGSPTHLEDHGPVDPDAFVSRVVPLQNAEGAGAVFANLRGLLAQDTKRIGKILLTQNPPSLTIVDLAHNVRYYEQVATKLDGPALPMPRARVQLYQVEGTAWGSSEDSAAESLARLKRTIGAKLMRSFDVDLGSRIWQSGKTVISDGPYPGEGEHPRSLKVSAERDNSHTRCGLTVSLTEHRSSADVRPGESMQLQHKIAELGSTVPPQGETRVQAVLLPGGDYLVLEISGR